MSENRPLLTALRRAALAFGMCATLVANGASAEPLYAGEDALYAKAADEGLVVSFDTGPE